MPCPNCGFTNDPETGEVYDPTYPCPECGLGGAAVSGARVAGRFIRAKAFFEVGDYVWMGKYKNKLGQVIAFGEDDKGNPTITIRPVPQGRKQDKTFSLFKVWKVRPEQLEDLKAKGKIAAAAPRKPTPSQLRLVKTLLREAGQPEPENLEQMTQLEVMELIYKLKQNQKPTSAQVSYARHLLQQLGEPEPEGGLESLTISTISELIDGLKKKRGRPVWYGNGQFGGWRKDAVEGDDHDFDE